MAELKSGYRSTEFYGNGLATIFGGIAASGFLNPDWSQVATNAVGAIPDAVMIIGSIVDGLMQLVGLAITIIAPVKYNQGRSNAKKAPDKVVVVKK